MRIAAICLVLPLAACADDVPATWVVKTRADAIAIAKASCMRPGDDALTNTWTVKLQHDTWQVQNWDVVMGNRRADIAGIDGKILSCD